jgi:hypothetical protein
MSQINTIENTINQNFTSPDTYKQQIETLKQQFISVLDDFKQDFINYNMNSQNNEYQQTFFNDKNNLNVINNELTKISQNVETSTNELNKGLILLNELIKKTKEENRKLKIKLGIVEDKNNTSDELIDNYKQMYEYNYLRNVALGLSIVISWISISKVYSGYIKLSVGH